MAFSSEFVTQVTQFGLVNTYLVREDDGLTLVDAAMPRFHGKILAAAEKLGLPITRVALTHGHPDHTGSLNALFKALPDAEFIAAEREAPTLTLKRRKPVLLPGEPTDGKLNPNPVNVHRTPDRLVNDGDLIGSLRVISSPGHSVGHVALLETRSETLLCGDVYSTVLGVATTAGPYLRFPLPGAFTWHRPTELASAKKLRDLDPRVLAPGHGPVVTLPVPAMDQAIQRSGG